MYSQDDTPLSLCGHGSCNAGGVFIAALIISIRLKAQVIQEDADAIVEPVYWGALGGNERLNCRILRYLQYVNLARFFFACFGLF